MINNCINGLKWPIALLAVISLPAISIEFWRVVCFIISHWIHYTFLFIGLAAYWGIRCFFRGRNWGSSWLSTLEHELTHAFFATVTCNRVVRIRASWENGGSVQYRGSGNWLITIAPYFFPTFAVAAVIPTFFLHTYSPKTIMVLAGFFISYHIHTTWLETRIEQPDIQKVGVVYALLFLPSANLLSFLIVLTMLPSDGIYTSSSLQEIYWRVCRYSETVVALFF